MRAGAAHGRGDLRLVGQDHSGVERWQETLVQVLALLLHIQSLSIFVQFALQGHEAPMCKRQLLSANDGSHEHEHIEGITT